MIKIFKNIRRKVLSESKVTQYFLYAFGEIILVVLGILIALQVNNWNENNKKSIKTDELIVRLTKEVLLNLENSKREIVRTQQQINDLIELISLVGKPLETNNQFKYEKLLMATLNDHRLGLDLNTIYEAQANGEISSIMNFNLRENIYKLSSIAKKNEQREAIVNADNLNHMMPYFYKNMNLRNINYNINKDYYNNVGFSSLEKNDYNMIFSQREFENLLDSRIFYAKESLSYYKGINKHLINLKELLKKE